jgi:hypothetical protein
VLEHHHLLCVDTLCLHPLLCFFVQTILALSLSLSEISLFCFGVVCQEWPQKTVMWNAESADDTFLDNAKLSKDEQLELERTATSVALTSPQRAPSEALYVHLHLPASCLLSSILSLFLCICSLYHAE